MARRPRNTESTDTTTTEATEATTTPTPTEENTVTATTEAPVEADASTEAVEATIEANDTETPAETPAPAEVDLSAFEAAVKAAVEAGEEERDPSTGTLAEALVKPVQAAYRELEGIKGKNAAKKFLNEAMRDAVNSTDIQLARSYMQLNDACTAAPSGGGAAKAERVPADPTQAHVDRLGTLYLAAELVTANRPENVDEAAATEKLDDLLESAREQADGYLAWVTRTPVAEGEEDAAEPEASAVVKAAVKLALGKTAKVGGTTRSASTGSASTGDGTRKNIAKHIAEVFENVEPGTFLTVAEIRKVSTSEYPDSPPSAGAISSRLFPDSGNCTIEGITPGQNAEGNRGASKP
jgi:hypothetical protein